MWDLYLYFFFFFLFSISQTGARSWSSSWALPLVVSSATSSSTCFLRRGPRPAPQVMPPLHTYHMSSLTTPLTHFSYMNHAYSLHWTYFLSTAPVGVNSAACSRVLFGLRVTLDADRGSLFSFQLWNKTTTWPRASGCWSACWSSSCWRRCSQTRTTQRRTFRRIQIWILTLLWVFKIISIIIFINFY